MRRCSERTLAIMLQSWEPDKSPVQWLSVRSRPLSERGFDALQGLGPVVMRGAAIFRAAKDAARPKGTRSKDPKECPARFSPSDWRAHRRIRDAFRAIELTAQDGKERGSGLVECPMARYCGQVNQELGPHALHLPPEDVRKLAETMRAPGVRPECHVCGESLVESGKLAGAARHGRMERRSAPRKTWPSWKRISSYYGGPEWRSVRRSRR